LNTALLHLTWNRKEMGSLLDEIGGAVGCCRAPRATVANVPEKIGASIHV
jgi:hypothetical protein